MRRSGGNLSIAISMHRRSRAKSEREEHLEKGWMMITPRLEMKELNFSYVLAFFVNFLIVQHFVDFTSLFWFYSGNFIALLGDP
jgi:hypothetical protein